MIPDTLQIPCVTLTSFAYQWPFLILYKYIDDIPPNFEFIEKFNSSIQIICQKSHIAQDILSYERCLRKAVFEVCGKVQRSGILNSKVTDMSEHL